MYLNIAPTQEDLLNEKASKNSEIFLSHLDNLHYLEYLSTLTLKMIIS